MVDTILMGSRKLLYALYFGLEVRMVYCGVVKFGT